ncbi:MAG: SIS domain-containing protein [Actinobacteria bacterium]|nr:SIS domain-containing protein [Actinomycetota bacterium]
MTFHIDDEINTQPENWLQAAALAPQFRDILPQKGERVAVVGCGTSWFMSMAFALIRESTGQGEADSFTASEMNYSRPYDRVIALTRTGTTTETVGLLNNLKGKVPTVVFTEKPDSPATKAADNSIVLDFASEKSVVSTRFATSTLALLRAHIGQDLTLAAQQAKAMLSESVEQYASAEQISFLGTGWTIAMASEAALKTRETAQFWAETHPAMDYRHGPISIAQPGRVVWCFGTPPANLQADVEATGAFFETRDIDPMAHLVLAHRTAVELARKRNFNPDQPRHLSRSVVLS